MKAYKEQKLKEFEKKFAIMIKPQSFNNQFACSELSVWISQSIDDIYTKAIEDAIEKLKKEREKVRSQNYGTIDYLIQRLQQLCKQ